MRKITLVHQLDSKDCGAACIAMITDAYSLPHTPEEIRQMCHCSKSGVSLKVMANVLEELGFKTVGGGGLPTEKLINEATLPCIVH